MLGLPAGVPLRLGDGAALPLLVATRLAVTGRVRERVPAGVRVGDTVRDKVGRADSDRAEV